MRWKTLLHAFLAILVIGVALLLGHPDTRGWSETSRIQSELEALCATNRALRTENQRLSVQVEALKDNPAFLEQVAREDLGYIRDGEVVVIVPR